MESYKLIADIDEMKWYFDHVIAKPNFDEAYAFCMSSRHKKLTPEERQTLGQSSDDEMLDPQVVFPGRNGEWDFLRWVKGALKYEVPKLAYTTRGGHPFLEKTLVLYSTPNPSDERAVIKSLKEYIAIHEQELTDSALKVDERARALNNLVKRASEGEDVKEEINKLITKGERSGVNESLYKLCHSLVKFKRLQFDATGSRNWVDFDLDLNDKGKSMRDEIYKNVHQAFLDQFGRNNFVAVKTTGGYHFLVRKELMKFNPHHMTEHILEQFGYKDCADEFKYNNNCMLPTPGTYQYCNPVVVVNKEDFDN